MNAPISRIPTFRKIFRAVCNWRIARRVLLTLAVSFTLVAVFYAEEDWRGQRAWDAYRAELVAQGVPMSFEQLQPPAMPDDQNFALTPLIQSLLSETRFAAESQMEDGLRWRLVTPNGDKVQEWYYSLYSRSAKSQGLKAKMDALRKIIGQQDLVQAMSKFSPVLDEFTAASRLPAARYPIADDLSNFGSLPNMIFLDLRPIYFIRALAELDQEQTQNAADDISTVFRLANLISSQFTVTSQLVALAMCEDALQPLREGLAKHRWSDAQLAQLQADLQKHDFIADLQRSFQAERIYWSRMCEPDSISNIMEFTLGNPDQQQFGLDWLRLVTRLIPRGWVRQNQIVFNQEHLKLVSYLDPVRHTVDVASLLADSKTWPNLTRTPYNFFGLIMFSNLYKISQNAVTALASVDEAQVACAIERYRLVNGQLPAKLDDLAPQFITKVPNDVFSGGPLHYQPGVDGHFLLYEVGLNGRDDGGKDDEKNGHDDVVWPDTGN